MRLRKVTIENYRAIDHLELLLHPRLTVLHGDNGHGKTSVLSAIAVGLGRVPTLLPEVSGISFLKTDRRGRGPLRVELSTTDGITWDLQRAPLGIRELRGQMARRPLGIRELRAQIEKIIDADINGDVKHAIDLPIFAFYDTDRAVFDIPQRRRGFSREFSRYQALEGAFSVRTNFRGFFIWFHAKENEELRVQRQLRNFNFQLKELRSVRDAINGMMNGVSGLHTELNPLRFVLSVDIGAGKSETLEIAQLSGGYRIMLSLVADLARRMAQGNPHLDNPLESEAIVLIDEVDLHLHPKWQQGVLSALMGTFPNSQFIVSTHSPQVLTTVKPEHVVELYREGSAIVAGGAGGHTYGATAGDVLTVVMGAEERPPGNEFVVALDNYMRLVGEGKGESEDALRLRSKLENLSPNDPALDRADIAIRRQNIMRNLEPRL